MPARAALRPSDPAPHTGAVDVAELSRRMAEELYAAANIADDCQMAVESILDRGLNKEEIVRLQALDALTQTLVEIAGVLDRLAGTSSLGGASSPDLLDPINLSDLRRRLRGGAASVDAGPADDDGDEPELW